MWVASGVDGDDRCGAGVGVGVIAGGAIGDRDRGQVVWVTGRMVQASGRGAVRRCCARAGAGTRLDAAARARPRFAVAGSRAAAGGGGGTGVEIEVDKFLALTAMLAGFEPVYPPAPKRAEDAGEAGEPTGE